MNTALTGRFFNNSKLNSPAPVLALDTEPLVIPLFAQPGTLLLPLPVATVVKNKAVKARTYMSDDNDLFMTIIEQYERNSRKELFNFSSDFTWKPSFISAYWQC
ncbi:hypothetical protein ACWJJH_17700 [Endozoicomonadaceae bacterium StTr2]